MTFNHTAYMWCVTAVVMGVSASWFVVDLFRMRAALADRTHERNDKIFGSLIGLTCGVIGVTSAITYNL